MVERDPIENRGTGTSAKPLFHFLKVFKVVIKTKNVWLIKILE